MAFWDTSAVVPLCIHQPATGILRRLFAKHRRLVVWWGTPVEVRAALARLQRTRLMSEEDLGKAVARFNALRRSWTEVAPTERVRSLAESLPERHVLSAADALQLASALAWCRERPQRRPFVCLDRQLGAVAEKIGFSVIGSS